MYGFMFQYISHKKKIAKAEFLYETCMFQQDMMWKQMNLSHQRWFGRKDPDGDVDIEKLRK